MMTDNEVMAELKSDSKINRARREFSSACGWIQQAGHQRVPLSPIHMRRMEFEAVMRIVAILTEQAHPMTMQGKIEQSIDELIDLCAANPVEAKLVDPRAWSRLLIYAGFKTQYADSH